MAIKEYEAPDILVRFDTKRCIHAAECVHGLPAVFDADRRPWILPDAASADELAAVIEACPSGALTYERRDGGAAEVAADAPTLATVQDGPIYVRGSLHFTDHEGRPVETGPRAALCRCGASKNKPFCDNSHIEAGFSDG
ncbi:MAG: (4Fe-4S)-binding protein [Gemmatimonadota bacterium]